MSERPSPGVKGTVQLVEPNAAERSVARRSAEARATIPDLELSVEVDMGACVGLVAPSTAILIRAVAVAPALAVAVAPAFGVWVAVASSPVLVAVGVAVPVGVAVNAAAVAVC